MGKHDDFQSGLAHNVFGRCGGAQHQSHSLTTHGRVVDRGRHRLRETGVNQTVRRAGNFLAGRMAWRADRAFNQLYAERVRRFDNITEALRARAVTHLRKLQSRPMISVLMPVYNGVRSVTKDLLIAQ